MMQSNAVVAQRRAGLLPRLVSAPFAVTRSGRRLTMASLVALEMVGSVRRSFPRRPAPADVDSRVRHLSWFAENLLALHGVQLTVEGSVPQGPCVLAANHMSYMDPVAISATVPCSAIAKQEIAGWPVIGSVVQNLGVLMVKREDAYSGARVLRQGLELLRLGIPVLAFPEGTTSEGDDVLPMRRGVFGIARIAGVPVVPISIQYDSPDMAWVGDTLFFPHYVRTTARAATRATLRFGAPIPPDAEPTAEAMAHRTRGVVRDLLHAGR